MASAPAASAMRPLDRKMPPVTEIGAASMVAIAASVIYLASYLPKQAPRGPAIALIAIAAALQLVNWTLIARIRPFAWKRFFQVGGWTLLAYLVIAGMIEFAFIYDKTAGVQLVLLTLGLVLFVLNVPLLVAFTVARYQAVPE